MSGQKSVVLTAPNAGEDVEQAKLSFVPSEMQNGKATLTTVWQFLTKLLQRS